LPLSARARIEIYFPVTPKSPSPYKELCAQFVEEFCYTWGGCSLPNMVGFYLSKKGSIIKDQINLLYTDTDLNFDEHLETLAEYVDQLRTVVMRSLQEEAVLIAVVAVYHST
jgi:hypothetical protein